MQCWFCDICSCWSRDSQSWQASRKQQVSEYLGQCVAIIKSLHIAHIHFLVIFTLNRVLPVLSGHTPPWASKGCFFVVRKNPPKRCTSRLRLSITREYFDLQEWRSPTNPSTAGLHQLGAQPCCRNGCLQEECNCRATGDRYQLLCGSARWRWAGGNLQLDTGERREQFVGLRLWK